MNIVGFAPSRIEPLNGEKPRVRQDLVRGKPGYMVRIGTASWLMEPQADLTAADGVAVPSRPDFLLRPVRGDAPPVAVFMDGFEYHRDSTGEDSRKRMALTRAGFKVWSLTWQDLEVAFDGAADTATLLDAQNPGMARLQRALDERWQTATLRRQLLREPALVLLLRWLRESGGSDAAAATAERWRNTVFTALLGLFDIQRMRNPALREQFERSVGALPGQIAETLADLHEPAFGGAGTWLDESAAGLGQEAEPQPPALGRFEDLFLALPLAAVEPPDPTQLLAVLHLRDDEASTRHANYRPAWNRSLRLFNLLQFLPDAWWITRQGMQAARYPEFAPAGKPQDSAMRPDSDNWAETMELAAEPLRPAMRQWAAGLSEPEVGFELTDAKGQVRAEAELAWPARRVAVLHGEQCEQADTFKQEGWEVYSADEDALAERVAKNLAS